MAKKEDIEELQTPDTITEPIVEGSKEWYEEKVEVRLFKDNGKYSDPLFVSVNGESLLIPRGQRLEIKRKFALVIEQSLEQDEYTAGLIATNTRSYEQNLSSLIE